MQNAITTAPVPPWLRQRLSDWDLDALVIRIADVDTAGAFPGRRGDEHFGELLRNSINQNVHNMQRFLMGTVDLADLDLREPALFARKQAEIGSSQSALQHSYRLGTQAAVDDWGINVIDEGNRQGLPVASVTNDLLGSVRRILAYFDAVQGIVSAEFADQEQKLRRTGQQLREQIILDLLNREDAARSSDYLSLLSYDLSHVHLAVQIDETAATDATRIMDGIRRDAGASGILVLHVGVAKTIFWLGRPRSWPAGAITTVLDGLRDHGVVASVTHPVDGLEGLRQTYRSLTEMAKLRGGGIEMESVLYYPDVRLDTLLLQDRVAARRFVEDELGRLAEDSVAAERLRHTVVASFAFGSHVQTAQELGVHEHTVRNRLRRVEELLGHSLNERRTELQIALRLLGAIGSHSPLGRTDGNGELE